MRIPVSLALILAAATAAADIAEHQRRLGFAESDRPSRDLDSWARPQSIVVQVPDDLPATGPLSAEWIRAAAPGVDIEIIPFSGDPSAALATADAYFGWCRRDLAAHPELDYVHIYSAGLDGCTRNEALVDRDLIATNSAKAASETIAEHSIALMLALTRNLHQYRDRQAEGTWQRGFGEFDGSVSVRGKTLLVLGLGGIGTQTAQRAHDLGMRIVATRNSSREGPDFVDYVGLADETLKLAAEADVVFNALPLTRNTRGSIDSAFFAAIKPGAYYVSVGRGGTTDTGALMSALAEGRLAGAALDVTDPEPLPDDHPLWSMPNVIITPHVAASSDVSFGITLELARENLRRYAAGEPLLNPVDFRRGY